MDLLRSVLFVKGGLDVAIQGFAVFDSIQRNVLICKRFPYSLSYPDMPDNRYPYTHRATQHIIQKQRVPSQIIPQPNQLFSTALQLSHVHVHLHAHHPAA